MEAMGGGGVQVCLCMIGFKKKIMSKWLTWAATVFSLLAERWQGLQVAGPAVDEVPGGGWVTTHYGVWNDQSEIKYIDIWYGWKQTVTVKYSFSR